MGQPKVLVADDSLTIQKVIRLALANEGYDIDTVSDGEDAAQQISLTHPDLILVDVSLPKKNAFQLKEDFNREAPNARTRFVLMSSAFEQIDEDQCAKLGFDGRLVKPFDPSHLRTVIKEVIEKAPEQTAKANTPPSVDITPSDDLESELEPAAHLDSPDESGPEIASSIPKIPPPPPENLKRAEGEELIEGTDTDIRSMTQETLDMAESGETEGWGIQESAKKEPALQSDDIHTSTELEFVNPNAVSEPEISEDQFEETNEPTFSINTLSDLESPREKTLTGIQAPVDQGENLEIEHLPESHNESKTETQPDLEPNFEPDPIPDQRTLEQPEESEASQYYFDAPTKSGEEDSNIEADDDSPAPSLPIDDSFTAEEGTRPNLTLARPALEPAHAPIPKPALGPTSAPPPPTDLPNTEIHSPPVEQTIALSNEQIQEIVGEQIKATIREMAQDLIPDIAEKIIKEEIHRMLSQK